jgi:phosphate transport system substrate-binding protein
MTKGFSVKLSRAGFVAAGVLAGVVALTACGSDTNNSSAGGGTTAGSSAASSAGSSSAVTCATGSLKGEGSTAQQNAMTEWIKQFQTKCSGATINYNGTGSGAGVKQFNGNQVDFAGSDSALNPDKGEVAAAQKRCGSVPLNLPMVTGPIAVAYKLNGVQKLVLTPDVMAKIFLGEIKTWNDPAIKDINSGANLPGTPITVFFRSDASGTSNNFQKYLAAAAPTVWTAKPDNAWQGKTGQGKAKSQGIQQAVQSTEGGIGYLEWSYAVSGSLTYVQVNNGGGAVELTADTAGAAVAQAKVVGVGNDLTLKLDYTTKDPSSYPIILVTYEIVCTKYSSAGIGSLVKAFLSYTAGDGQSGLKDLGYAPLPSPIQTKVQTSVGTIS